MINWIESFAGAFVRLIACYVKKGGPASDCFHSSHQMIPMDLILFIEVEAPTSCFIAPLSNRVPKFSFS